MWSRNARNKVVAVALAMGFGATSAAWSGDQAPATVRDLHYGEALFHFFQEDWFTAINRLSAADLKGRLPNHRDEAELLLGGLYLSYGLKNEAGDIFNRLLDDQLEPEARNRAWYYLAKISNQRGDFDDAWAALERIDGELDADLEPRRQLLAANVLMATGQYRLAAETLDAWKAPRPWRDYARVNLGTALVKAGAFDQGAALLEDVGRIKARDDERLGLKDKANVALAFARLARGEHDAAVPVLERVRLEGPFSSQALLGLGWARAANGDYTGALAPWLELGDRNPLDSAVQESLLAVPYAYMQLGARRQAMDTYVAAIETYQAEIARIDAAVADIRAGSLNALLDGASDGMAGWFWEMSDIEAAPEPRYLYMLMARHEFQEALKDWRDLHFLSSNLSDWSRNVSVYEAMIANRRAQFDQQLAILADDSRNQRIDELERQRDALMTRFADIAERRDSRALADEDQQAQLERLDAVDARLERIAGLRDVTEQRDQARIYRGLVVWELGQQYHPRLWEVEKALRAADTQLTAARERNAALNDIIATEPARLDALAARVSAITPRIDELELRVNAQLDGQGERIAALAADALETQRARLSAYLTETRFALATLHDQASGTLVNALTDMPLHEGEAR